MKRKEELIHLAREARAYVEARPNVLGVEVFCASNGTQVGRFNYTSAIPSNGLEELKGTASDGIGLLVVFKTGDGIEVGFGSEEGSLSLESIKKAFGKAVDAKHHDPEFVSLPMPTGEKRTLFDYHDPDMMDLSPEAFSDACWRIADGAITTALSSSRLAQLVGGEKFLRDAKLILGGDLTLIQERMAICSTTMPDIQTDESTLSMAFLTAMVEKFASKGSGYGTWTKLSSIDGTPGKRSMDNAIASIDSIRVPSGKYTVVFGPAAMAEMMDIILGSLSLGSLYAESSLFSNKLGRQVAAGHITLVDNGSTPGLVASKSITCEGLPTGLTTLIQDGVFVGTLANWYEAQRILRDPRAKEKLGQDPREWQNAFIPRNGFRFSRGGGRVPSTEASSFGTNVILSSSRPLPLEKLIRQVKDGLLVGRMWYVYPMGPVTHGDFTGTVIADSFVIRDGRIVKGLALNSLRINDNLSRILHNILAISEERDTPLVWAADSIRHMPQGTLVTNVYLEAIAENVLGTEM